MSQDSSEITILGVQFGDEVLEITYSEARKQNDHAALVNQMLLQSHEHGEVIAILLEELRELVDLGLILLRDPPQTLDPRQRMREAARVAGQARAAESSDEVLPVVPDLADVIPQALAEAIRQDDEGSDGD